MSSGQSINFQLLLQTNRHEELQTWKGSEGTLKSIIFKECVCVCVCVCFVKGHVL